MRQTHRANLRHVSTPATGTCVWLTRVPPATTTKRALPGTSPVPRDPRDQPERQARPDRQDQPERRGQPDQQDQPERQVRPVQPDQRDLRGPRDQPEQRARPAPPDRRAPRDLLPAGRLTFGLARRDILPMEALPQAPFMSSMQVRRTPPSQRIFSTKMETILQGFRSPGVGATPIPAKRAPAR